MTENITMPASELYEPKQHGKLEYPIGVYPVDLRTASMNYIPWHWHDEVELNIVLKGSVLFFAGEHSTVLTAGQGQFVNRAILHSIKPADDTSPCELFSIVFHPDYLFGYGSIMMASKYLTPVVASKQLKRFILKPEVDWQKCILDASFAIYESHMAQEFGYELFVKAKLCEIWLEFLNHFASMTEVENISVKAANNLLTDEVRVKTAMHYIEQHHNETITLDDIAASAHISKSECCRCFKRTLKLSPFEYLMRYRISEATRKLQEQDPITQSISDLAFSVGFNNTSYFNKLFKQYLHCTPKEYKRYLITHPYKAADDEINLLRHTKSEADTMD